MSFKAFVPNISLRQSVKIFVLGFLNRIFFNSLLLAMILGGRERASATRIRNFFSCSKVLICCLLRGAGCGISGYIFFGAMRILSIASNNCKGSV